MQRIELALPFAVAADDTAGEVDGMRLQVDAGSLAVTLALAAVPALVSIDGHSEIRMPADKAKQRADGAQTAVRHDR